jgi:outer membrane cobalamin receptor
MKSTLTTRLSILMLLFLPSFFAEELYELDLEDLMEVRVEVASLFEEPTRMAASSVSVLQREEWMLRGARRGLRDMLDYLPGVVSYSTLGGTGIAIRGYTRNTPVARGKAYLFDGVPLNSLTFKTGLYGRANLNPNLFDRLEMVRGPGSALYGEDAFHGVIALKTYAPVRDETEVYTVISDHKYSEFNLRTSQSLTDRSRFSAALSFSGQGNQNLSYSSRVPALAGGVFERDETWQAGSALLKWSTRHKSGTRWNLTFLSHQYETDESPGNASFQGSEDIGNFDTRFNLFKLDSVRELSHEEELEWYAYRWSSAFEEDFLRPAGDRFLATQKDIRQGVGVRYKRQETENQPIRLVAGAEVDRTRIPDVHTGLLSTGLVPDPHHGLSQTVKSLYVQTRTRLREDRLYFHLGGRLDRYPNFGSQLTPRAGLTYQPEDNTTWKLLYGNSFRAPSGGESQGLFGLSSTNIKPEEIDTYELIYMRRGKKSNLTLTWFESSWKDGVGPNFGAGRWENTGLNESSGLEFEWSRSLNEAWNLELSGSRVNSRNLVTQLDYEAFPKNILNFLTRYNPQDSRFRFFAGLRYMDEWKDGTQVTSLPLKSYVRTDITIAYNLADNQEAYLWVKNFFDRDLRTPSVWNSESGIPEPGRAVGIGLTYRF